MTGHRCTECGRWLSTQLQRRWTRCYDCEATARHGINRTQWRRLWSRCWVCGERCRVDVHEIADGPARERALVEPAAWFAACNQCHLSVVHGMPLARQLAYKREHDPQWYGRVAVNRLRGRADDAVSEEEVARCVC